MRIYSDEALETHRTRKLLAHAKSNGILSDVQHQQLQAEIPTSLRTTNLFLRLVLFFFTTLCVAAAAGLFVVILQPQRLASSVAALLFAILTYAAAEFAVDQARFYHHGIEEALTVCSIAFLFLGLTSAFAPTTANQRYPWAFIAAACILFSLWIWHRFGLWYTFALAMLFVLLLPADWTASETAHRILIAAVYASGILSLVAIRTRDHSETHLPTYSLAEALLWLGTYLTLNLKVVALQLPMLPWLPGAPSPSVGTSFYWTTWLLTWLLPPVLLTRAIRLKDRSLLTTGTALALLTLLTNKPYLGWPVHTWDPIVLGIVLTAAALILRRWLNQAPNGIRHGFTAARLSQQDEHWLTTGSSALGLIPIHSMSLAPPPSTQDLGLAGGASGGAGATRDF